MRVFKKPEVALIATGDEVLLPGEKLTPGKLYASNLLTLHAWCRQFGFGTVLDVVGDRTDMLQKRLARAAKRQDAIVTSGGAWHGDKDITIHALEKLSASVCWTDVRFQGEFGARPMMQKYRQKKYH